MNKTAVSSTICFWNTPIISIHLYVHISLLFCLPLRLRRQDLMTYWCAFHISAASLYTTYSIWNPGGIINTNPIRHLCCFPELSRHFNKFMPTSCPSIPSAVIVGKSGLGSRILRTVFEKKNNLLKILVNEQDYCNPNQASIWWPHSW